MPLNPLQSVSERYIRTYIKVRTCWKIYFVYVCVQFGVENLKHIKLNVLEYTQSITRDYLLLFL